MSKVYLVTGANSGLGLDATRQLALLPDTKLVYVACRTTAKAKTAIELLTHKASVDPSKLAPFEFDASSDLKTIELSIKDVKQPLDGVILNAGGFGHDATGTPTKPNKVVSIHQINVIAHVQLVELLKSYDLLKEGSRIVFSGSEAARGVPMMMIGNPRLGKGKEWFERELRAENSKHFDPMKAYAVTKAFAALYFNAWARRNPSYHVLVVSPGGTAGTAAMTADAVPSHFKVMLPVMMPLLKIAGIMHPLEDGTQRYVDAVLGRGTMAKFPSGTFVASARGTTGPVKDQTLLRRGKQFLDKHKQEEAFAVLSDFAKTKTATSSIQQEAPLSVEVYA